MCGRRRTAPRGEDALFTRPWPRRRRGWHQPVVGPDPARVPRAWTRVDQNLQVVKDGGWLGPSGDRLHDVRVSEVQQAPPGPVRSSKPAGGPVSMDTPVAVEPLVAMVQVWERASTGAGSAIHRFPCRPPLCGARSAVGRQDRDAGGVHMMFGTLAVISLVALLGPLLALPTRLHLPVILGELIA